MIKKILYGIMAILLIFQSICIYKNPKLIDVIGFGFAIIVVGVAASSPKKTERHDTE